MSNFRRTGAEKSANHGIQRTEPGVLPQLNSLLSGGWLSTLAFAFGAVAV